MSKKTRKRKNGLLATCYRNSLIISNATSLSARLHKAVSGSAVARFFCCTEKLDKSKSDSVVGRTVSSFGLDQLFLKIKTSFARLVESSSVVAAYRRLTDAILRSYVRDLGIFLLSFGLFSLSAILLRVFMFDLPGEAPDGDVICSAAVILSSLLLLPSKKSVSSKLAGSAIFSSLLTGLLGISPLALRRKSAASSHGPVALVMGTVLGTLCYIFHPTQIIAVILVCASAMLLMYSPESGLFLSFVMIPFAPYGLLRIVIFAAAVSYALRLMRCKRNLSFSATDVTVLLFALSLACALGVDDLPILIVGCIVYLLAVNLIRSFDLLEKSINAISLGLLISSFAAAVVSVCGLLGVNAALYLPFLAAMDADAVTVLTLVSLPMSLLMFHNSKSPAVSLTALLFLTATTVNAVLSFSVTVWVGFFAVILIYGVLRSARLFNMLLAAALVTPFAAVLVLKLAMYNTVDAFDIPAVFEYSHWSIIAFGGAVPNEGDSMLTAFASAGGTALLAMLALVLFLLASVTVSAVQKSRLYSVRLVCGSLSAAMTALIYTFATPSTYGDVRLILIFFCVAGLISCSGGVFSGMRAAEEY